MTVHLHNLAASLGAAVMLSIAGPAHARALAAEPAEVAVAPLDSVVPDTAWADRLRADALAAASDRTRIAAQARALQKQGWNEYFSFPQIEIERGNVVGFDYQSMAWRSAPLETYLAGRPAWRQLFALAALDRAENARYAARPWNSFVCHGSAQQRCFVAVTRAGFDEIRWLEVDTAGGRIADRAFDVPPSRSWVAWLDADRVLVASPADGGVADESGYPRTVRLWRRGEPLAKARTVYTAPAQRYVAVLPIAGAAVPVGRIVVIKAGIADKDLIVSNDGRVIDPGLPAGAESKGIVQGHLIATLNGDGSMGGQNWPGGSAIALNLGKLLRAEQPRAQTVFRADDRRALTNSQTAINLLVTRDAAYLAVLQGGTRAAYRARLAGGRWTLDPVTGAKNEVATLVAADPDGTVVLASTEAMVSTPRLWRIDQDRPILLKQGRAFFDADGLSVTQRFARSADGTPVSYWLVRRVSAEGPLPTILHGYGGQNVPLLPTYFGDIGRLWLERGGAFAIAQVRGGGEFGAAWYRGGDGLKLGRAADDFIAVGEDLVARNLTTARQLGAYGHSQGGWLVATAAVRRPALFGAVVGRDSAVNPEASAGAASNPLDAASLRMLDSVAGRQVADAYWPARAFDARRGCPNLLLTTWRGDQRVPAVQSRALVAKMQAAGCHALLFEGEGGEHGVMTDETYGLIFGYLASRLQLAPQTPAGPE